MDNHGIAVSKDGYDVKTCADRFLCFSSAFHNLKVFARYSVSAVKPVSGNNHITIEHNLGFYAPFIVISNGTDGSLGTANSAQNSMIEVDGYTGRIQALTEGYVRQYEFEHLVKYYHCFFTDVQVSHPNYLQKTNRTRIYAD